MLQREAAEFSDNEIDQRHKFYMKIIVGLGNPGAQYANTRHNVGFLALDYYMKNLETIHCQSSFMSQICEIHFSATKTFFVKPQTFMNKSGQAVKEILNFYKANPQTDLLVVHDDKDLSLGDIKNTTSAGSAGHNGVQNIMDELGTKEFNRIRIGVEARPPGSPIPTDAFVLHPFDPDEFQKLEKDIFPEIKKAIDKFIGI